MLRAFLPKRSTRCCSFYSDVRQKPLWSQNVAGAGKKVKGEIYSLQQTTAEHSFATYVHNLQIDVLDAMQIRSDAVK